MTPLRDGFSPLFLIRVGAAWRSSVAQEKKKKKWEQDTDQCSCMHSASRLFWVTLAQLLAAHCTGRPTGAFGVILMEPWSAS